MITLSDFIIEASNTGAVKYLDEDGKQIKFKSAPKRAVKINTRDYNNAESLLEAVIPFLGGHITKINGKPLPRIIKFARIKDGNVVLNVELPGGIQKIRTLKCGEDKTYSFNYGEPPQSVINKIKYLKNGERYEIIKKYVAPEDWQLIAYLTGQGIGIVLDDDTMKYVNGRKRKTADNAEYGFSPLTRYLQSNKNYYSAWVRDGVLWLYSGN